MSNKSEQPLIPVYGLGWEAAVTPTTAKELQARNGAVIEYGYANSNAKHRAQRERKVIA